MVSDTNPQAGLVLERTRRALAKEPEKAHIERVLEALLEVTLENRKRLTRIETRICKIAEDVGVDVK